MASLDINFLAEKQVEIRARLKRFMLIQILSFSVLAIYALGVMGVFLVYFWLNKENKKIQSQVIVQEVRVQENAGTEMKQVFLKDKLSSLLPIFEIRHKHQQLADSIFTLLPIGISIKGFTIDEAGDINFSGKAANFVSLGSFLARLQNKNITPDVLIDFAEVEKITIEPEGDYGFSVILRLISLEG